MRKKDRKREKRNSSQQQRGQFSTIDRLLRLEANEIFIFSKFKTISNKK